MYFVSYDVVKPEPIMKSYFHTLDHALHVARKYSLQEPTFSFVVIDGVRIRAFYRKGHLEWAKVCPTCGGGNFKTACQPHTWLAADLYCYGRGYIPENSFE